MFFSVVINQTSFVSNSRKQLQKPKKSLKILGFEDLEDDSRSVVQNPVSVTKVCELVVRDHQVTLRLIGEQNITFNQMIHQILG
jgi:hypothetical protein